MVESKESWWKKKSILYFFKKNCFKDKNKPAHWVGHSKLRSLEINGLFKRTLKYSWKEASVTGIIEEEKRKEKISNDDDESAEDIEHFNEDKKKLVTIKEYNNTLKYQETSNLDIGHIASLSQQLWISMYEVIDDTCLEKWYSFQQNV